MDGAKTNASNHIELWTEAGGSYSNTGVSIGSGNSVHSLRSGGLFDHIFLADTVGAEGGSLIPDHNYAIASRICSSYFFATYAGYGAFYSFFNLLPSATDAGFGSRLAKW
jgi:hypothetical protein